MTITVPQETLPSLQTIATGEQVETSCEEASALSNEIQLLEPGQAAILRSLSDLCLSVIEQTEKTLPHSKHSPSFRESCPLKYLSQQTSDSSRTQESATAEQQSLTPTPTPQKTPTQTLHNKPSTPISHKSFVQGRVQTSPQHSTPLRSIPVIISLPNTQQALTDREPIQNSNCNPTLSVTIFNKENSSSSKKDSAASREQSSSHSSSLQKNLSSPRAALLSPMALFETTAQKETLAREGLLHEREDLSQEGDRDHHQSDQQQEEKEDLAISASFLSHSKKRREHHFDPEYLPEEIREFALSEAQLSQLLHIRLNHLDILRICAEIMKLMLNSREQDLLERRSTRTHFMQEAKKIADSFAKQARITKWLGIATATLGIFGGISPIIGELGGEGLLNVIRKATGGWQQASSKTFFEGMGKVCSSLSELAKVSSTVYDLRANAVRTIAESYKELFRLEHDEMLRSIEELKDHWRNMDSFLLQILQTQHDAVRSLYQ